MYGYIYKITNLIDGRIYIGKHKHSKPNLDKRYIASGILIKRSIREHGLGSFSKELIDIAETVEELNQKEKYWIKQFDCKYPKGYNLTDGGDGMDNPSLEIREKMALKKLGTTQSEETKTKRKEKLKLIPHTEEWIGKISQARKGQQMTDLCIQKSTERLINTHWYNNGIEENRYLPENVPEGWVKGRLNNYYPSFLGRNHTEEFKKDSSKRMASKIWFNNGKEEIRLDLNKDTIPEGFIKGRLKLKTQ